MDKDNSWQCNNCGLCNSNITVRCQACFNFNMDNFWQCIICGLCNANIMLHCQACFNDKPISSETEPILYKRYYDMTVEYSGGGKADINWPIYICDELNVNPTVKNNLTKQLLEVGELNQDYRENEPILNIIDPDLYVFKHYNKVEHKKSKKDVDEYARIRQYNVYEYAQEYAKTGYKIRSEYSWLATECTETRSNKIKIISPIHNLQPVTKYKNLYINIEYIFSKMLQLFNKFDEFKNRKNRQFQCIIKSQRYEIEDMSGYNGHWHMEGLTENIKYVGIYYFEKSPDLLGGRLKFSPIHKPSADWTCGERCRITETTADESMHMHMFKSFDRLEQYDITKHTELEVSCEEGTAVVFDNTQIVHRVRMIKNKMNDKKTRYRSFIAFFIIDFDETIYSTETYPNLKREYYMDLVYDQIKILSLELCKLICEFGNCGLTESDAIELRQLDIELRQNSKGVFSAEHWGNSGEQIWYKTKQEFDKETSEGERRIPTTDSNKLEDCSKYHWADDRVYNYESIYFGNVDGHIPKSKW